MDGRIDRREFLRFSTLLGLLATAAYAFVGKVTGEHFVAPAKAAMPKGGTYKYGLRILDVTNPHTYSWYEEQITRQTCEYLTKTGADNVTRPYLCKEWEVTDDLLVLEKRVIGGSVTFEIARARIDSVEPI